MYDQLNDPNDGKEIKHVQERQNKKNEQTKPIQIKENTRIPQAKADR